jgi:hypothetical protein
MSDKKREVAYTTSQNQHKYNTLLDSLQGSQNYDVLKHLIRHGSITALEASRLYGILALHSRISDLRNKYLVGIQKEMIYKGKQHWGIYTLEGKNERNQ